MIVRFVNAGTTETRECNVDSRPNIGEIVKFGKEVYRVIDVEHHIECTPCLDVYIRSVY